MNPTKLMAVALCAAACVTTTAFAEDDFGIESASPVAIADPVNPQPGMECSAYLFGNTSGDSNWKKTLAQLSTAPAIKKYVDKADSFNRNALPDSTRTNIMKWEGFIKCKKAGMYSFSFVGPRRNYYAFRLNGVELFSPAECQKTVGGNLKLGWNKIVVIVECTESNDKLELKYKPNESLSEPRLLTPAMMFHDQKPEEDW